MKIVVDNAIPFVEGVFEPYAEVVYKPGSDICSDDVRDADALLVRTRTRCDARLLEGSDVRMIASATIGMDHIDCGYCASHGIYVQNAPGCNAGGVMNYVFSALYGVAARKGMDLTGKTFGIVGVGNVGGRVEAAARLLGFNVLLCDPPRAEREGGAQFCSLEYLLAGSDIVSLHLPLDSTTEKMADRVFFDRMRQNAFFINTCRGEVVDEAALKEARPKLGPVIIDTWNNEPFIDGELLSMADIATPHISGYSLQGKQKGTAAAVRAVARFFEITELFEFFPPAGSGSFSAVHLETAGKSQGEIASAIQYNYPIFTDDFLFRTNLEGFESIRTEYNYRNEFFF
ncbi:MAG: 4-phosphoerythronate dehydrogenase [Bacteroidales bacterium]|nr:4-phosphoerythronate dehydrogenase [Bacteroidales bacterium]